MRITGLLRAAVLGCGVATACAHPPIAPGLQGPDVDRRLRHLVELRLSTDHRLCPYDIDVAVYHRTVLFWGDVSSPFERRRAERIAFDAGADRVVDELTLRSFHGQRSC